MNIERAKESDLLGIMSLIHQAQKFFRENEIDQWQNNYPTEEVILTDIRNHESYVVRNNNQVIVTMTLTFTEQPEYSDIRGEKWKSNDSYATIHRLAVDNESKGLGLATKSLSFATEKCRFLKVNSLRTDTYRKNFPMQKTLEKNGFEKRGIIKRVGVADMIGFEKIVK
ncbi:GNAT family N-acetyltransferase [Companilactobacillus musae]|uniref:GNAT family N-acetyltransferase n=1 Tax=Companilactobacillus musae TaxID=1903258 RepID=UPI000E65C804|nr:GNAT family N-acetyltransferase [Companilactobacillus musae]